MFCAAAAELANQPGITRLRADADFKPSNSLPAEMLLGPAPQCRSDNVFKDELTGVVAGTWDSTPYHRIVRAHRLNEFMVLLAGSVRFAAPMAACCPRAPAMRCSCRRAHRSAGRAAIAWRSSTCARTCPPDATIETPAMSQPLRLVETSPNPPARADVVVIGGGIIGVFTAYYLARRGLSVAVVEKGRIGAEQSSRNWGWCRQQNRDARELPMSTRSLELWDQFAADSGEDTGFNRCGLLYLSNDEAQIAGWAKWREFAKTVGVTTHMLSGREASERGQATGRAWKGGVFSPSDGTADPAKAAPAVAAALMKLGGTVHQNCAARGIEMEGGRRQRRRDRSRDHQDPHRGARRRCVGVVVLQPARRAVSRWPRYANRSCVWRRWSSNCRPR